MDAADLALVGRVIVRIVLHDPIHGLQLLEREGVP